jgi:hypothetical protein
MYKILHLYFNIYLKFKCMFKFSCVEVYFTLLWPSNFCYQVVWQRSSSHGVYNLLLLDSVFYLSNLLLMWTAAFYVPHATVTQIVKLFLKDFYT